MRMVAACLAVTFALAAGAEPPGAVPCQELIKIPPWTPMTAPDDPLLAPVRAWRDADLAHKARLRPDEATIRERLVPLLKSPSAPTRHWAAFELSALMDPAAVAPLFELLKTERDEAIVITAFRALAEQYRDPKVVPLLVHFMGCDGTASQSLAATSALWVPDPAFVAPVVRLWSLPLASETRRHLLAMGTRILDPRLTAIAFEAIETSFDPDTRNVALAALTKWRDPDVRMRLEAFYPETIGWSDWHRIEYVRVMMNASDDGAKEFVDRAFASARDHDRLRTEIARLAIQYEVGQRPFEVTRAPLEAADALITPRVGEFVDAAGDWGGVWSFYLTPFRECQQSMSPDEALDRWLRLDAVLPRGSRMRSAPLWSASQVAESDAVHDVELAVELLRTATEVDPGNTDLRKALAETEARARRVRATRGVSIALEGDRLTIANATDEAIELPGAHGGRLLLLADELSGGTIVTSSVVKPKGSGRVGIRVGARSRVTVALALPPCRAGSDVAVRMFASPGGTTWTGAVMSEPVPCRAR